MHVHMLELHLLTFRSRLPRKHRLGRYLKRQGGSAGIQYVRKAGHLWAQQRYQFDCGRNQSHGFTSILPKYTSHLLIWRTHPAVRPFPWMHSQHFRGKRLPHPPPSILTCAYRVQVYEGRLIIHRVKLIWVCFSLWLRFEDFLFFKSFWAISGDRFYWDSDRG